jgi:Aspartyl protease
VTLRNMIVALLLAGSLPVQAEAACSVEAKATVPLAMTGNVITLPVEVNGIQARFILDTGAGRSMVTVEAVQRLGLARDPWVGTSTRSLGGLSQRYNANPRGLSLGGAKLVRQTLNHDTSMAVGVLQDAHVGDQVIDGLLGIDFLSVFDLDLDMPNARLTIFQVRDCAGRFLPWTEPYTSVPVTVPAKHFMILPVTLDGVPLRAYLDTGAGTGFIFRSGMIRMGLQPSNLAADTTAKINGVGPNQNMTVMHLHGFRTLRIGHQAIDAPAIWVADVQMWPIIDMLLGLDWLSGQRTWISYATQQIFVTNR